MELIRRYLAMDLNDWYVQLSAHEKVVQATIRPPLAPESIYAIGLPSTVSYPTWEEMVTDVEKATGARLRVEDARIRREAWVNETRTANHEARLENGAYSAKVTLKDARRGSDIECKQNGLASWEDAVDAGREMLAALIHGYNVVR